MRAQHTTARNRPRGIRGRTPRSQDGGGARHMDRDRSAARARRDASGLSRARTHALAARAGRPVQKRPRRLPRT
jgi:hypothetical protein